MTFNQVLIILAIIVSIILSAFFSAAETAFMSVQKVRLQHMVDTNVKGAKRVAKILEHPERLVSTVLLGDTLSDITTAVLTTNLAADYLGEHRGAIVTTFGLTIIVLIFGSSIPKTLAVRHSEKLAIAFARPVEIMTWLLAPFVISLSWLTSALTRMAGGTPVPRSITSVEEIRTMIAIGHREGTVEAEEAEMLRNVFEFGDRPVRDVMVPRLDVVAIEQGSRVSDYLTLYAREPLSQMPVYKDSLDSVVGNVSDKDILMGMAKGTVTKDTLIDDLMRPPYFTPESKPISKLFTEMREKNYRLAVVVDEYGGTAGIVSFTRMAEEVVGEVKDELSTLGKDFEVGNEYTFQIDGSMRIEEANEKMGLGLPAGDYETVAGFILNHLGHIPKPGEQLDYTNLKMIITRMRGAKIEAVLVTRGGHAETAP